MKIRQLQAFQAVMISGSTVGAAEILNISQPAVSRHISELEEHLGLVLFTRENRRLVPTREALLLQPEVNRWFDGMRSLDRIAADIRQKVAGFLRVAAIPALGGSLVAKAMAEFRATHGDVHVDLTLGETAHLHHRLMWNQADVAIAGLQPGGVRSSHLVVSVSAPCVCAIPLGHPLARTAVARLRDIVRHPIISYAHDLASQQRISRELESRGLDFDAVCVTPYSSVACHLVAQELGVSIVEPFSAFEHRHLPIEFRPIDVAIPFMVGIYVSHLQLGAPLIEAFVQCLTRQLRASPISGDGMTIDLIQPAADISED